MVLTTMCVRVEEEGLKYNSVFALLADNLYAYCIGGMYFYPL